MTSDDERLKFWHSALADDELVCVASALPEDKYAIVCALQVSYFVVFFCGWCLFVFV